MIESGLEQRKKEIEAKRNAIRQRHDQGGSGLEISAALSAMTDELILSLVNQESANFSGALVALGGYGRGLLNPYSDVDLLFLLDEGFLGGRDKAPHETLALLWDLGFKVGHAARTIGDTVAMGLADLTARTAMIEARFLGGNRELYDRFRKKYHRDVIRHKPNLYIKAKIDEMTRRRELNGRFAPLTEPNLKESPGGLRDYHTALWLLKSKMLFDSLDEVAEKGLMTADEVTNVERAHSAILRLRNGLHFMNGRPEERLSHTYQLDMARTEGYDDPSQNVATAWLMSHYFGAATIIERFADDMAATAYDYRKPFFFKTIRKDEDGLYTDGTRLFAHAFPPAQKEDSPKLLFNIARRISEEELKPAQNLRRGLVKLATAAPDSWFTAPHGGRLLLSILRLPSSFVAIRLFHETGLLARLIPEFGPVTHLSQFDRFHRYSVDWHTLVAIQKFEDIPHGATVNEWMRDIYRAQPDLEIIKLGLLLHDLGKRAEDRHLVEETDRTEAILLRLGLDDLVDAVSFLVDEHVFMSDTAQKFDFSDPATLRSFCAVVKNRANLRRLYLLTYADIAAVGPGIWNEWKDKLLYDLYDRADRFFVEGDAFFEERQERIEALCDAAAVMGERPEEIASFLRRAPHRYLVHAEPETIIADMKLFACHKNGGVAIRYEANKGDATGRLTLAAADTLGLVSAITGLFVAKNVNVVEAHINSFEGKLALDSFTLEGPGLNLFADAASLVRFEKELAAATAGERDVAEAVRRHTRYMGPEKTLGQSPFDPHVAILNHLSDQSSIVEVWAPDRVGLLYDIARTMAKLGIDIDSAKIGAEGPKAFNIFYVTNEHGEKITDTGLMVNLKTALIEAMRSPAGVD